MAQQRAVPVDHVEGGGAELVPHPHDLTRMARQQRVPVAAEADLRLVCVTVRSTWTTAPGTAPASPAAARRRPAHRPWSTPRRAGGAGIGTHADPVQTLACAAATNRLVTDRAPPALRDGVRALLHRALAPGMIRRADRLADADLIMQRHRAEAGRDPPRPRMTHRGHPIKAPPLAQPTQAGGDLVQPLGQMRLVLALGDPAPPPARMRQHPEQQTRRPDHTPARRRIGQLEPIPLGLLTGRMPRSPTGPCSSRHATPHTAAAARACAPRRTTPDTSR